MKLKILEKLMVAKLVHNIQVVAKTVKALNTDAKRAHRQTLTNLAFLTRGALERELENKLTNPVAFITKAYRYKRATDLEKPVAKVFVAGPQKRIDLLESITLTGEHIYTRSSLVAKRLGVIRGTEALGATRAIKPNRKGNIGPGGYARLRGASYETVGNRKSRGYFKTIGGKRPKIFKPIDKPAKYKPLVNAQRIVDVVIATNYDRLFDKNYQANVKKTLTKRLGRG